MQSTNVRLYTFSLSSIQTYMFAALFIVGNILLPQTLHMLPDGGKIWLPIYFFTLIGAYKYGINVGLLTALLSPVINSQLFGMPAVAVLPAIMIKSSLLAVVASMAARYTKGVSIVALIAVVAAYQTIGTLAEWAITGNILFALQDFRLGLPGMLAQIVLGYVTLRYIISK